MNNREYFTRTFQKKGEEPDTNYQKTLTSLPLVEKECRFFCLRFSSFRSTLNKEEEKEELSK